MRPPVSEDGKQDGGGRELPPARAPNGCAQHALRVPARAGTLEALRHLSRTDPVMGALIRRTGPCTIRIQKRWSPFQSLVRAVVYQQLHGRAAAAIFARLVALFGGDGFPSPEQVLAMSPRRMRGAGLSRAK